VKGEAGFASPALAPARPGKTNAFIITGLRCKSREHWYNKLIFKPSVSH
jgi:hypothetical protein